MWRSSFCPAETAGRRHPWSPSWKRYCAGWTGRVRRSPRFAATVAITHAGLLRGRRHTSNGRKYLEQKVPGYSGAADYVEAPAVRDGGLITASGLADVEFAAELMHELEVLDEPHRRLWTEMFRTGRMPAR